MPASCEYLLVGCEDESLVDFAEITDILDRFPNCYLLEKFCALVTMLCTPQCCFSYRIYVTQLVGNASSCGVSLAGYMLTVRRVLYSKYYSAEGRSTHVR